MTRVLMIDGNRPAMQTFGLACLEQGVGVVLAENLCEGVRALLTTPVSLVAVDAAELRLAPREHAALFERVAPGVPVVVLAQQSMPTGLRAGFEREGFEVRTRPLTVPDLLARDLAPEAPCVR